jgi:hypothetical protein
MAFVAPRFDPDVVGRVGEEEVGRHAGQEPVEVLLAAGVAAEEAMVAEEPEVAGLGHGLVGWLGDVVGVGQPYAWLGRRERREHRRERLGLDRNLGEELVQLRLVGRGHRRERVEAGEDEPLLVLGEVHIDDWDGGLAVRQGLLHAEVAVDEVARALVDDDLRHVSDGVQHVPEGRALGLAMSAPVRWVGEQLVRRLCAGANDAVRPRRGSGHRMARHVLGCRTA